MKENKLFGYCGLYCGACRWHISFPKGNTESTDPNEKNKGTCPGCKDDGCLCGFCEIKKCAKEKDIATCTDCELNPCEEIINLRDDGMKHHADISKNLSRIKEIGTEKWLSEQEDQWTCPCGSRFSWYDRICPACGAEVTGY